MSLQTKTMHLAIHVRFHLYFYTGRDTICPYLTDEGVPL